MTIASERRIPCPNCGTAFADEPWATGLCVVCLAGLALSSSRPDDAASGDVLTLDAISAPLRPGLILGRRYRIRSRLGGGGMGEVWRAFDLKLRVDVALKALHPRWLCNEEALETLRQEVRVAREVLSPNVCRVFQLEELDGLELISMEFVDGTTLRQVLRERSPLELDEARDIAAQMLAGLEAIHDADLVHRDVKPENIMLTRAGRVVVMDFGIARALRGREATTAVTASASVAGTPAYMAPEQTSGEPLDARADIFAAGLVLAEMIDPDGVRSAEARRCLWQRCRRDPPDVADTPWAPILRQAISPGKDQRPDSVAAFARALEELTALAAGDEGVTPYPGLAAFTEEDAEDFFGRELEVEDLWKKLPRPHLLGLIGPSGTGKTSFLRAGVVPARPPGWAVVMAKPGHRPFVSLARSLTPELAGDADAMVELLDFESPERAIAAMRGWRDRHGEVLVILDQFEELFTQNTVEVQRSFAELLGRLALEADVHVLIAMRDDFLAHCGEHAALTPLFDGLTVLNPLAGSALRRALVQPALRYGYRFEDEALVEQMLGEVEGERGALPLLAFAAAQLWQRRDRERGVLTREAYEHIGGVGGALAQHAEAALEAIGLGRLPIVRELLRNLVTAQGTRAIRERADLLSVFPDPETRSQAEEVTSILIDARLLTSYEVPPSEDESEGHHLVEIIHESLLDHWPRLVRWRTQDAGSAQLRDQLRQAAALWRQRGRSDDVLWTGAAFKEFELWRERYSGGLSETEEDFAAAMTRRAHRTLRRRWLAVAAVIAALLAVVASLSSLWQRSESARSAAVREAERAEAARLLTLGQLEVERDPTVALAWATASLDLADTPETRRFVVETLWRQPTSFVLPGTIGQSALAFSPAGRWLGVHGYVDPASNFLIPDDGGPARSLDHLHFERTPLYARFTPDSRYLLFGGGSDSRVQVFSTLEGEMVDRFDFGRWGFAMTADGSLARGSFDPEDPSALLIESTVVPAKEPRVLGRLAAAEWEDIAFDRTGIDFAGLHDGVVSRLRLAESGFFEADEELWRPAVAGLGLRFSADGSQLALLGSEGIEVWSRTDRRVRSLALPGAAREASAEGPLLGYASFDDDGSHLLSGVGRAHWIWDLAIAPGADPLFLRPRGNSVLQKAFHPSGAWLATGQGDGEGLGTAEGFGAAGVRLWALEQPQVRIYRRPVLDTINNTTVLMGDFTSGGDGLAFCDGEGVWYLPLRPVLGSPRRLLEGNLCQGLVVSTDREGILYAAYGHGIQLLSPAGEGARVVDPPGPHGYAGPAFDADGGRVAWQRGFAGEDGTESRERLIVKDLGSGETSSIPSDSRGYRESFINSLEFAGDGTLYTAGAGGVVRWNLDTGESVTVHAADNAQLDLTPDGRWLLVLSGSAEYPNIHLTSGELRLFDLESGTSHVIDSHGDQFNYDGIALSDDGKVVVTSRGRVIRVGRATGEPPHLLIAPPPEGTPTVSRAVPSPDGRWVASSIGDQLRLWPMPDLSKPPLHTLPHDELLSRLRALTNFRVVRDPDAESGWTLEAAPFPGWQEVPTWQ